MNRTLSFFKILLISCVILLSFKSQAQSAFITKWQTTTNNQSITLGTNYLTYNYNVDWGDGNTSIGLTVAGTHTYVSPGLYTVSVTGTYPSFKISSELLKEVSQWGTNPWNNMGSAFKNCTNLNLTAIDTPILAGVLSMSNMFQGCSSLNPTGLAATALNLWHLSHILNMSSMFYGASSFNQNLNNWNVSSVKYMSGMFYEASSFNQNLNNWNVSSVKDMNSMFFKAYAFNQNISSWHVDSVTNMNSMFYGDSLFNQNISSWHVDSVTSMFAMFYKATAFNQNISNWNVSSVTNMGSMFSLASSFNQDLSSWNVSQVTNMNSMFYQASSFNQNLSLWNVSSVKNMRFMFSGAIVFNQDISLWHVDSVTDMNAMFYGATAFNQNISNWNVSSVTDMNAMFYFTTSFNQNLGTWNISNVSDMSGMLSNSNISQSNYDSILIGWNNLPTKKPNVELGASGLKYCDGTVARANLMSAYNWNIKFDAKALGCVPVAFITKWQTTTNNQSITLGTYYGTYNYNVDWGDGSTSIGLTLASTHTYVSPGLYTVSVTGIYPAFKISSELLKEVSQWGTNPWNNMGAAFKNCTNLNLTAIDTPILAGVLSMSNMFQGCSSLNPTGLAATALSLWHVDSVTSMVAMFYEASSFNQNLNNWNVSSVKDMNSMFFKAYAFNQNISSWHVDSVTNMNYMFYGDSLFNQNISSWHVDSVTSMFAMFYKATAFNQNISNWNVSSVTNMNRMFYQASSFNQNLSLWNVSSVTDMNAMFYFATSFNQNLGTWNISNVSDMFGMLSHSNVSQSNYDNILIGWNNLLTKKPNVQLGASALKYCDGKAARTNLNAINGWNFVGDAEVTGCIPLPILLLDFKVQQSGNNVIQINWTSGVEQNLSSISVEHSSDAVSWKKINTQQAKGSNSKYIDYDRFPNSGKNYYRLSMAELDGGTSYSIVQSIDLANTLMPKVFPNPTTDLLSINYVEIGDELILIDLSGHRIWKSVATKTEQTIHTDLYASGIYFISIIRDGKKVLQEKIVKM